MNKFQRVIIILNGILVFVICFYLLSMLKLEKIKVEVDTDYKYNICRWDNQWCEDIRTYFRTLD